LSRWGIDQLLQLAKKSALKAGRLLRNQSPSFRHIHQALRHDVKIKADQEAEKLILKNLARKTSFSILTEESGYIKKNNQQYHWIIDPLDGSLNYSRNIPISCISIGLWNGNRSILGVVYDFHRDELFSGITDKGAWLNGRPIKVSKVKKKSQAVLLSGFPVKTDYSQAGINTFIKQIQTFKKVRLIGSAALSLAYVACSRVDAYYEKDIMLWDVGGGIPIVLGARGDVKIQHTKKHAYLNVYATNGLIHQNTKSFRNSFITCL